ncbi:hypothetical protein DIZ81_07110 [Legionella taurinensis]|uniref:Uncharacterized protein n=1 Tax=Legionella taurinensis TaxID=70611 RepID=A0A3A5L388_9GAMM|nr:Lpg0189 family type II secretion system effector [Legionella taurinensis]MDX1837158.1 Lpg0189 family type II secretion system effector [Legionella taurinensis]PUT40365.1 hypothetical protein DB744_07110 [Legionella taurinensis]PUT40544.1 hypothetical protein DB746_11730 [Legionella taurinensis]PUT42789.1 hypothetical protein DB743_12215 [Legionella taurinensis]PUT48426.1 hypothetical protein DB745_05510 [Legionella taurinensis]
MKMSLVASLFLLSPLSFANLAEPPKAVIDPVFDGQAVVKQYSNFQDVAGHKQGFERHQPYPTQIVRVQGALSGERHCEAIIQDIEDFFVSKITYEKFLYNTLVFCGYDPKTEYAVHFAINSYFDPLNDGAIYYLENYLRSHNGQDLLGVPFEVESATGVAVSLNIDAGVLNHRNDSRLLRYRHDNQSHYFASNYDLMNELTHDIYERFYSNDPGLILPFINRWFYAFADRTYSGVLSHANYVELQPELLFLMEKAPKVYTSPLRMYFGHHCTKYDNKHCL